MEVKHQLYDVKEEEIREQIRKLAASYTPEWLFNTGNPDAGSVLAILFAQQLEENIGQYNLFPERLHEQLTALLGLSPLPARPARGTAVIGLMRGAPEGTFLPEGTRLNGVKAGQDEQMLVFETEHDLYATCARITDIIGISGPKGRILPVYEGEGEPSVFSLFCFDLPGIQENRLFLLHRNFFNGPGDTLLLRAEGEFFEGIKMLHYTEQGLLPVKWEEIEENTYKLASEQADEGIKYQGEEYGVLCLEMEGSVKRSCRLSGLTLTAQGGPFPADFVLCAGEEGEPQDFLPFGKEIGLYKECYVGCDRVFRRAGARIALEFELSFEKRWIGADKPEEPFQPKLIRRRRPEPIQPPLYQTSAQETVLEYFNGTGWKRIRSEQETGGLFQGIGDGHQRISFLCPGDWDVVEAGGFTGLALRFRILRADGCYQEPCEHIYPKISGINLSYSHEGKWNPPHFIKRICGTKITDYSRENEEGRQIPAFSPLPYSGEAYYFGFRKELGGGPVGIYFEVGNPGKKEQALSWEYSTRSGFRPLKLLDDTGGFAHSGTIMFSLPADFGPWELEGKRRFWLKVNAPEKGEYPVIKQIRMNAVTAVNTETKPIEEFFIDRIEANLEFTIHADSILRVYVWVNENESLTQKEKERLLKDEAGRIKAVYGRNGELKEFYVRWEETEDFGSSRPGDRHYCLDRRRNRIRFGDGVNVRIPKPCSGPAFTVQAVCCSGQAGNIEAGGINGSVEQLMFVEAIDNPGGAFGGSDMEGVVSIRRRGAGLIGSGGRILTLSDFERESEEFSDVIDKAACISRGRCVLIALLIREDRDRGRTFRELSGQLKKHLLSSCECTIRSEDLFIMEPFFVEISVEVWAVAGEEESAVKVRKDLIEKIGEYLEPVSRPGHRGWEIGSLPAEGQIRMALSAAFHGFIRELSITASYTDEDGRHQTSLQDVPKHPFCIGTNGKHRVFIQSLKMDEEKGGDRV